MTAAARIAQALAGKRAQRLGDNSYLVPCPVPSHGKGRGDRRPSLHIADGDKRLLVRCYAGCDPRDVLDVLRRRGLIENHDRVSRKPERLAEQRHDQQHAAREHEQHEKARWLWSKRRPITDTVAETYLRARGIVCPLPATLGFLPATDVYPPTMIACFGFAIEPEPGVLAAPADVDAVHVTRLLPDGSDRERGDDDKGKFMLGRSIGKPIVIAPPNDLLGLCICEGIEDALTAHQALGIGAWTAGAAGRMPGLADAVPSVVDCVTIYTHGDKAGRDGAQGLADALVRRNRDDSDPLNVEILIEGLS
jgi:hypothetical protein